MALWQAKQVGNYFCTARDGYVDFHKWQEIYSEYTDKIEPYGIDEAWLDVSGSGNLKGSGQQLRENQPSD